MSFNVIGFYIFLALGIVLYYIIPKKVRWVWLLVLSYYYYYTYTIKTVWLLMATTLIIYGGGLLLDRINVTSEAALKENKGTWDREQKKAFKAKTKRRKKGVMVTILVLIFGILAVIKYTDFVLENVNAVLLKAGQGQVPLMKFILPLGISFYTFQSASYIIDLYNDKFRAEKNPFKVALFVSFFPQLLQGPIGRFDRLAPQLFEGHDYDLRNIEFGLQRIFWGLFKKMILADRAALYVNEVFTNYANYGGFFNILGVLMYSIQLYADFSGGIDVVIGVAQMFGITMDENFKQPYFSTSIGDFWRRWHITLGTWMKDYIFYPFSLSKGMNKLGKWGKKHLGRFGKGLPICLADLLVFLVVGIWHGAAWKYIIYGMYNGVIMAFSSLMAPVYEKQKEALHIKSDSKGWHVFQIVRTFILVNISWYFDMGTSLSAALSMMKSSILDFSFSQFNQEAIYAVGLEKKDFIILLIGCVVVFIVSVLKEKGIEIRKSLAEKPLVVRWAVYYLLVMSIYMLGYTGVTQGFIYANF